MPLDIDFVSNFLGSDHWQPFFYFSLITQHKTDNKSIMSNIPLNINFLVKNFQSIKPIITKTITDANAEILIPTFPL